jgi:hypothetical protein
MVKHVLTLVLENIEIHSLLADHYKHMKFVLQDTSKSRVLWTHG